MSEGEVWTLGTLTFRQELPKTLSAYQLLLKRTGENHLSHVFRDHPTLYDKEMEISQKEGCM